MTHDPKLGGGNNIYPGDRVRHGPDGREGIAKWFTQDGDAYVSFDNGSDGNVKWNNLTLLRKGPNHA